MPEQIVQVCSMLAQEALAHGYHEAVWTNRRVADLIQRTFGVSYHRAHASRLLRRIGQSVQKPIVRASQRDDVAIVQWQDKRWPTLKKGRGGRPHHPLHR